MVDQYTEHMLWSELGFVPDTDFMPETVEDVYSSHLYCMSWFYCGSCPFDSFEAEYEDYLREQVEGAMNSEAPS